MSRDAVRSRISWRRRGGPPRSPGTGLNKDNVKTVIKIKRSSQFSLTRLPDVVPWLWVVPDLVGHEPGGDGARAAPRGHLENPDQAPGGDATPQKRHHDRARLAKCITVLHGKMRKKFSCALAYPPFSLLLELFSRLQRQSEKRERLDQSPNLPTNTFCWTNLIVQENTISPPLMRTIRSVHHVVQQHEKLILKECVRSGPSTFM